MTFPNTPDEPVVLDASYRFGNAERRRIDEQILALQASGFATSLSGYVGGRFTLAVTSAALVVGDCFVAAGGGTVTKATAGTLAAGGGVCGVATSPGAPGEPFYGAAVGSVPATITGLAAGTASPVRVNTTTARIERVATVVPGDYPVGFTTTDGTVNLDPTLPTGGGGSVLPLPLANGNTLALVAGIPAWASLNLAGGANFVTGLLPNLNQAAQTLTGDANGNTGASVVSNLTLGSDAQGDFYYRGASALARLPAGTSGKFLKTLGAGANPLWSDVDKLVSAGVITITSVGSVDWNAVISTLPIDTVSAPATIFTVATLTIPTSSARAYAARIQVRDTSGVGYFYGELRDSFQRAGGVPAREGGAPAIVGLVNTGTLAACTFAFSVSGNDILLRVTTGIAASRISGTCEALL